MLRRAWRAVGALSGLAYSLAASAHAGDAAFLKSDEALPVVASNTMLLEGEASFVRPAVLRSSGGAEPVDDADPPSHLAAKYHARTCSAAAIRIPGNGVRLVTALHCTDEANLELFDGQRSIRPRVSRRGLAGIDVALLDLPAPNGWAGLATRPASSVPFGERLCAWRMSRGSAGLKRERICARLMSRQSRAGANPLLVMSHPYPLGTSGSPLVDVEGRAVGVVVASDGLAGFAEPIESVFALALSPGASANSMRR